MRLNRIGWWVQDRSCDEGGDHEFVDVSDQDRPRWCLSVRCVKCRAYACITETGLQAIGVGGKTSEEAWGTDALGMVGSGYGHGVVQPSDAKGPVA